MNEVSTQATEATAAVLLDDGDRPVGSAVLVSEHLALTCAHVVAEKTPSGWELTNSRIILRFGFGDVAVPAPSVHFVGDLDAAVLELAGTSDMAWPKPLGLWPARRPPHEVSLFGFPGSDPTMEGMWRDYAVAGSTRSGLVQLRWSELMGSIEGQSGGPVVERKSHQVVGLIQSGSREGAFDRYLPIHRIASAWPGLRMPWMFAGLQARDHVLRRGHERNRIGRGGAFFGREEALSRAHEWLRTQSGPGQPLVIIGQPGAGKSAVLSRATLDTSAESDFGAGLFFHARGSTATEFIDAVSSLIGAPPPDGAEALSEAVAGLPELGVLAIMVDALDESATHEDRDVVAGVLAEMARLPWVRVVVATRAMAADYRFHLGGLLGRLGVSSATARSLVDLDSPTYADPQALRAFAAALLAKEGVDYPGPIGCAWVTYRSDVSLRDRMASFIASRAEGNFLVAALIATYLSQQETPLDPAGVDFDERTIPGGIGEAFDKYMELLPDEKRARAGGLLTAVAYAKGSGISDTLWKQFAQALGYPVDQYGLDELRQSAAVDFLLHSSTENGERRTRLYHQALVDQLLPRNRDRAQDRAVLKALLAQTHDTEGGWACANDYLLSFTAEHALDAGRLPEVLQDASFVVHADMGRLVTAITALPPNQRIPNALVILQAASRAAGIPPRERAALFALSAAHIGSHTCADFSALSYAMLTPMWAHSLGTAHQQLTGHRTRVDVVSVGRLGDRDVIISGDHDGTVRVWDEAGHPIGKALTGHTGLETVGRLGDRDVIISRRGGHTVRVWDEDGRPMLETPTDHSEGVHSMAMGRLGDQDVIVTGGRSHILRVWDGTGHTPLEIPTDHSEGVHSMAMGRLGNQDVIVTGGWDGTVRVWDGAGHPMGNPLTGHTGPVASVAVGRLADRDVIVSSGWDGTVRVWDEPGDTGGELSTGHGDWVGSMAVGRLGNRDVIVTGGIFEGTVRVWDRTGRPVGEPLTGPTGVVYSVAVGRLGDRDVIVSGNLEHTLRVWDQAGQDVFEIPAVLTGWVPSVAVGRLGDQDVIVAGSSLEDTVRVWDQTGQLVGVPLIGHTGSVQSITVGRLGGRDVIISGSTDRTVRMWDEAGHPVGEPLTGHTNSVTSVAIGQLGDRDVIISGSTDRTVHVWDQREATQIRFLEPVSAVAIVREGLIVASGRALVCMAPRG